MKKQKPTNKLAFEKAAVAELNNNQLFDVNGGSLSGRVCDAIVDAVVDAVTDATRNFTRPIIK
jgi:hypothetical protein